MARRYVLLTVQMIAEVPADDDGFIPRFERGLAHVLNDSWLHAGEVNVHITVLGEVQVGTHGYAIPWVE